MKEEQAQESTVYVYICMCVLLYDIHHILYSPSLIRGSNSTQVRGSNYTTLFEARIRPKASLDLHPFIRASNSTESEPRLQPKLEFEPRTMFEPRKRAGARIRLEFEARGFAVWWTVERAVQYIHDLF